MSASTIKVGDRVVCLMAYDGKTSIIGKCGTVANAGSCMAEVAFDECIGGWGEYGRSWGIPLTGGYLVQADNSGVKTGQALSTHRSTTALIVKQANTLYIKVSDGRGVVTGTHLRYTNDLSCPDNGGNSLFIIDIGSPYGGKTGRIGHRRIFDKRIRSAVKSLREIAGFETYIQVETL